MTMATCPKFCFLIIDTVVKPWYWQGKCNSQHFPLLNLKSLNEWLQSKSCKSPWCHTECLFSAKCRVQLKWAEFLSGYRMYEGTYLLSLSFTVRFGLRVWQRAWDRQKLKKKCHTQIHETEGGQASFCCLGWLCYICRELDAAAATR